MVGIEVGGPVARRVAQIDKRRTARLVTDLGCRLTSMDAFCGQINVIVDEKSEWP